LKYLGKHYNKNYRVAIVLWKFSRDFFALIGVISAVYFGWINTNLADHASSQNYEVNRENIALTISKMRSEEFQTSLKGLSSNSLIERVGSISILENIARNFPLEYYWPTVHVLLSYVRLNCNRYLVAKACSGDDVQEIVSFLSDGEYDVPHKKSDRIDLSNVKLSNIDFSGGKFGYANFYGVIFDNVNFTGAILEHADFRSSIILSSKFFNADSHSANFSDTKLKSVNFFNSDLRYSLFGGAHFEDMQFSDSKLQGADFCNGYDVKGGDVKYICAAELTCHSFKLATLYETTGLPAYLSDCKYKIMPDPRISKLKEVIKRYTASGDSRELDGQRENSLIEGRLVYRHQAAY
jgi:uncharacterized protein YjbI with pentapeptide repeats